MVEGGEREQPLDDIFQLMMATSLRHGMLVNVVNYPNIALLRVVNYHDLLYIYIYIHIYVYIYIYIHLFMCSIYIYIHIYIYTYVHVHTYITVRS